jgi:general secretion pathway protein N
MKKLLAGLLALLVFVSLFAVIVAATLPAATAYRFVESRLQPLRLQGVTGSLWEGRATQASVYALPLGELRWKLDPWATLSLAARGEAALSGRDLTASTTINADRARVRLSATNARMPAALLSPALDIPSLVLLGELDLQLDAFELRDGYLQWADGMLVWRNAGVSGAAEARFADVSVRFKTVRDGLIEGTVSDGGGSLAASGKVVLEGAKFSAEIRLAVRGHDPQLAEALLYVGERSADGSSLLRVQGELRKVF